jgi:hypothetical protein
LGLVIVEEPNDVIRLAALGLPTVAFCSNTITRESAGEIMTVFLDCGGEGEKGMKQALGYLAQLVPVRLAWTSRMYGGKYRGRQPESISADECEEIHEGMLGGRTAVMR